MFRQLSLGYHFEPMQNLSMGWQVRTAKLGDDGPAKIPGRSGNEDISRWHFRANITVLYWHHVTQYCGLYGIRNKSPAIAVR